MADMNYVSPATLENIAGGTSQNSDFPNIGPLQGVMRGQAWNQTQQQLDLARSAELMRQSKQQQELSEFMTQAPYRTQAQTAGFQAETAKGNLTAAQDTSALARNADDNKIKSLTQRKEIQDAYAALNSTERGLYTQAFPAIQATLDKDGNPTPETQRAYDAFVRQHDQMIPGNPISGDPKYGTLTPDSLTTMKVIHAMTLNDPKYQQQVGLQGQKIAGEKDVTQMNITSKERMQSEELQVKKEMHADEWAKRLQIAEMEHGKLSKIKSDSIDAQAAWDAYGRNPEGYARLTPREKALVNPDVFQRIWPQYSLGLDQRGQAAFAESKGKTAGALEAIGIKPPGGAQNSAPAPQGPIPSQGGKPIPNDGDWKWIKEHPEDAADFEKHFGIKP